MCQQCLDEANIGCDSVQLPTEEQIFPSCSLVSQHVGVKQNKKYKNVRMPWDGKGVMPLVLLITQDGGHMATNLFLAFQINTSNSLVNRG